jgi:formate-dependent nitrite reductase cytochrome c552 subunit
VCITAGMVCAEEEVDVCMFWSCEGSGLVGWFIKEEWAEGSEGYFRMRWGRVDN